NRLGVSADVVRALGHRLPVGADLNYPDSTTHLRPIAEYEQVIVTTTRAHSWYTGLLVAVRGRPKDRFGYSIAYTWSSSENDTEGRGAFPQNQSDLLADRGPARFDARHRLTATGTADLPFACRLSVVVTARSGLPYNLTTGTDDNRDGVSTNDRPA